MDGCATNLAAPWTVWSAAKVGSKITGADAALTGADRAADSVGE